MTNADQFFALHVAGSPLILPNAWDAASARIYEDAGFPAIATSSAAMAWALGYADGEAVDTDALFAAIARIVRVVRVPVSADLEAGFGTSPEGVVRSFERAIDAGVVGANLEDFDVASGDVVPIAVQVRRIEAMRARAAGLGVRFFINARTDLFLHALGDQATRLERTIERLRAYADAGADGVFVPGVADAAIVWRMTSAVDRPLNVLAGAATPPVATLAKAGVARISVGSAPMRRTLGILRGIALELRDSGKFAFSLDPAIPYDELNALFT